MSNELPLGWTLTTLGEVAEVHDSRRIPLNQAQRAVRPGPYPYYGANGQVGTIDDFLFEGDHILLAEDGGYFDDPFRPNAYAVTDRFWVNNHAHILRAGPAILHDLLLHALNATDLMPYVNGTTRLKLTQADMRRIPIFLPPLAEQRRIVTRIEALFARTRRARSDLLRIAPLARHHRDRTLATAFAEEWPQARVADLAETTFDGPFGSNLKSNDYSRSGTRVVRLENIGHLRFIGEKETFIPEEKAAGLARHRLRPSDVLFSSFVDKEVRVCLFPDDLPTDAINKADCFCIRVHRAKADPRFIALRLAAPTTYEDMRDAVHGATRPRIGLSDLKEYRIGVPPLGQQSDVVAHVEHTHGKSQLIEREATRALAMLDRLERAILAQAFRGELVLQDSADEPAAALLARLRGNTLAAARRGRPRAGVAA